MAEPSKLYVEILEIAKTYMGIAAQDYIERRCRIASRGANPEEFSADKLSRLVAGIEMTAKVYMTEKKAAAFAKEVADLQDQYR